MKYLRQMTYGCLHLQYLVKKTVQPPDDDIHRDVSRLVRSDTDVPSMMPGYAMYYLIARHFHE